MQVLDESKLIYLVRVLLGIVIGILCGFLKIRGLTGLCIAVLAYLATYISFKKLLKKLPERHYFIGLMEFIGLWLTLWTVIYTLMFT